MQLQNLPKEMSRKLLVNILLLNSFRSSIGIEDIISPWHNRYLSKSEINLINPSDNIPEFKEFSGSYYFISRMTQ